MSQVEYFDVDLGWDITWNQDMADIEKGKNPQNFKFVAPTENVDGSPISSGLVYKVYREVGSDFEEFVTLPPSLNQDVDGNYIVPVENFPEGRSVIAMTATDGDGDESGFSNTVGFSIAVAPKAPILL